MNNFLPPFYELFISYETHQDLFDLVFNNLDFSKIGWILVLIPLIILIIFYKVWEPMRRQRFMWIISMIIIAIIVYASTSGVLYLNNTMLIAIDNFRGGGGGPDPEYFIFQMSMISVLYAFILSFIYSLIIKRFSTNNSHNPF